MNFCALGAIFLTPFWFFDSTLDRLLPQTPSASLMSPRADAATARLRDHLVIILGNLKKDIRADMCRRDSHGPCVRRLQE